MLDSTPQTTKVEDRQFSLITFLPPTFTDVKNNSYGGSSHGTSNSCKVKSGIPPGLDFYDALCCHHSPLLQSPGLSAKHHLSPPLAWPTWSLLCVELHLLSLEPLLLSSKLQLLSYSQQQSLSFVNGCPPSGLQTHVIGALLAVLFHNSNLLSPLLSTQSSTSAPSHFIYILTSYWKES